MTETVQEKETPFILKNKLAFIGGVLITGWLYDFLFWRKMPGISMALFIFILLGVGFYLARQQEVSPARGAVLLVLPIVFFAVMTFIRVEPTTVFLNFSAALLLMALLAHSFLGGHWWQYTFKDYFLSIFSVGVDTIIRPVSVFSKQPKAKIVESEDREPGADQTRKTNFRRSLAILRGILIAFPIVLVFGAMLAEADPIFEQAIGDFLDIFHIKNLDVYIFRSVLICIIAYGLSGAYLHAFYKNHDENLSTDESKRIIPRFLGLTESGIILGSVNLLFLAFVIIQFQYFFGGQKNINLAGFTYAEYARRGFGELVAVAFFSLLLFMSLSFVTRKADRRQGIFSGLGVALLTLVTVILVSSFQRLLLYENAYGFSRQRTYTHVFIIWLGLLLAAVIVLEVIRKQRYFALATLVAGLAFITTLDVLNVDGFIVRHNVGRMSDSQALDIRYLASLSEDALPVLVDLYTDSNRTSEHEALRGAIACHAVNNYDYDYASRNLERYKWQSFHLSRFRAQQIWEQFGGADSDELKVYYHNLGYQNPSDAYVVINGENVDCWDWRNDWID